MRSTSSGKNVSPRSVVRVIVAVRVTLPAVAITFGVLRKRTIKGEMLVQAKRES